MNVHTIEHWKEKFEKAERQIEDLSTRIDQLADPFSREYAKGFVTFNYIDERWKFMTWGIRPTGLGQVFRIQIPVPRSLTGVHVLTEEPTPIEQTEPDGGA